MEYLQYLIPFVAAFVAGGVNSLAGGGTVVLYPGFLFAGLADKVANATNAFSLIPGSLGGAYAFRRELAPQLRRLVVFLIPAVAGSFIGARVLASSSDDTFRRIVPFLVIIATLIFAFSKRINAWARERAGHTGASTGEISRAGYMIGAVLQFCIAFYGGYFGAGMGILMLSLMSIIGMTEMAKMNALKNILAASINTTAVVTFLFAGTVNVFFGLIGAAGALMGGYIFAHLSRRLPQAGVRGFVIVFGCVAASWLFYRAFLQVR